MFNMEQAIIFDVDIKMGHIERRTACTNCQETLGTDSVLTENGSVQKRREHRLTRQTFIQEDAGAESYQGDVPVLCVQCLSLQFESN